MSDYHSTGSAGGWDQMAVCKMFLISLIKRWKYLFHFKEFPGEFKGTITVKCLYGLAVGSS